MGRNLRCSDVASEACRFAPNADVERTPGITRRFAVAFGGGAAHADR